MFVTADTALILVLPVHCEKRLKETQISEGQSHELRMDFWNTKCVCVCARVCVCLPRGAGLGMFQLPALSVCLQASGPAPLPEAVPKSVRLVGYLVLLLSSTERRLAQPDNVDVFVLTVPDKIHW